MSQKTLLIVTEPQRDEVNDEIGYSLRITGFKWIYRDMMANCLIWYEEIIKLVKEHLKSEICSLVSCESSFGKQSTVVRLQTKHQLIPGKLSVVIDVPMKASAVNLLSIKAIYAQLIAQSIGQAFQVAYMEFLKANGIEDPGLMKEIDYQDVLNQQEIYGEELNLFANKELHKEVQKSECILYSFVVIPK
ncbi:hypothetical protein KUTeg_017462 [Tegillarca granosa]|uniref:PID domain-containing protein n=1 Tax=Tegillarca granosa TaxID=220873 RepID=A0ABQ9EF04_TEGGR|nr:hypothetical protein KUTeg_017462 [Tegillarca granosa]